MYPGQSKITKIDPILEVTVGGVYNLQLNWVLQKIHPMKFYDSAKNHIYTPKITKVRKCFDFTLSVTRCDPWTVKKEADEYKQKKWNSSGEYKGKE
jgi:hypothetical protein